MESLIEEEGPALWLVQLDKSSTLLKPAKCHCLILELALKLKRWREDEEETSSFSMKPSPHFSFVNSIILRLGDIFQRGSALDKEVILKFFSVQVDQSQWYKLEYSLKQIAFFQETMDLNLIKGLLMEKNISRFGSRMLNPGILHLNWILNPNILLKSIKTGTLNPDPKVRSLSIRALGFLAWIAKDDPESLQILLEALESTNEFEVQAALTASSFFFLAFPPFGSLLLPRIRHLATDPSFSLDQRLTATWQLSLMTQSSSLSLAAFTVGESLALDPLLSLGPTQLTLLLLSLTVLAFQSEVCVSKQVKLLLTMLTRESTMSLTAVSLLCLGRLADVALRGWTISTADLEPLVNIMANENSPAGIQLPALQTLSEFAQSDKVVAGLVQNQNLWKSLEDKVENSDSETFFYSGQLMLALMESSVSKNPVDGEFAYKISQSESLIESFEEKLRNFISASFAPKLFRQLIFVVDSTFSNAGKEGKILPKDRKLMRLLISYILRLVQLDRSLLAQSFDVVVHLFEEKWKTFLRIPPQYYNSFLDVILRLLKLILAIFRFCKLQFSRGGRPTYYEAKMKIFLQKFKLWDLQDRILS